jgi:hypothetical protein
MAAWEQNEIVVEIDHPKNSDVLFHPTNTLIRSRLFPFRSNGRPLPWMQKYNAKGVPGQRIHLDVEACRGRIVDGLGDDKEFLKAFQADCMSGEYRILEHKPHDTLTFEGLTPVDVSTWMYWMKRLVEKEYKDAVDRKSMGKIAKLLNGRLPSLDEIIARGNVLRPVSDQSTIKRDKGETEFYQARTTESRQPAKAGKS